MKYEDLNQSNHLGSGTIPDGYNGVRAAVSFHVVNGAYWAKTLSGCFRFADNSVEFRRRLYEQVQDWKTYPTGMSPFVVVTGPGTFLSPNVDGTFCHNCTTEQISEWFDKHGNRDAFYLTYRVHGYFDVYKK